MLLKEILRENPDTLIKIYNDDVLMAYATGE